MCHGHEGIARVSYRAHKVQLLILLTYIKPLVTVKKWFSKVIETFFFRLFCLTVSLEFAIKEN